jgi:O-methyltransferase
MKWKLHRLVKPFSPFLANAYYMSALSEWRVNTPVTGYTDWYQPAWDYSRRFKLYDYILQSEALALQPLHYFEFGVSGGSSFRWWLQHSQHTDARFFGFDTFEGLPEAFGPFQKGAMAVAQEALQITDQRASFYKGLFQDTLLPFLQNYKASAKKIIHLDADLFTATIFVLSQLYPYLQEGDIILFDEFAVPTHEFMAFKIFADSFYFKYEVIASANNYLFLAVKCEK